MESIELFIEVVFYKYGTSERRVIRKFVNFRGNIEHNILAKYENNFFGKLRAKRQLAKWKKYHELHDFSGNNEYSVIEEIIC
ncbi:hypothetical protein [Pseudolactococcus paracarnosus]|uniref:Uncharacterized protein n=1 Tax=Pseudolactococcus paracarnosus TaxID=2749962 RepID=A0ABT0AK70_9LACT|nr:hypothetical protein [Lactococcus paracarnosus]MCJ1976921.1 hypothetical protein [Lactococcus paracarnosus]